MTPIPPIPEDLQCFYVSASERPNEYMGSAPFYNRKFTELIERIAKLTAEVALLESTITGIQETAGKQEELIERLERQNTRLKAPVSASDCINVGLGLSAQESDFEEAARKVERIIRSRAAIKEGQ